MKLRWVAWLALAAIPTGSGCHCFGDARNAELAPPGFFCDAAADCDAGECQLAKCVDGLCKVENREPGESCGDAMNKVCDTQRKCVTCLIDGKKNGPEGGVDCGIDCELRCANNTECTWDLDCLSGVCDPLKHLCKPPTCSDGVLNPPETDKDCGGTCPTKCADKQMCAVDADCVHNHCVKGRCCPVACEGACRTCPSGACEMVPAGENPDGGCPDPTDACDGTGHCKSCKDGIANPDAGETGLDCGGPICPPCALDGGCKTDSDCATCSCSDAGVCGTPTCSDNVLNGCETDIDCGGPCGPTCAYGQKCKVKGDCLSKLCAHGVCGSP